MDTELAKLEAEQNARLNSVSDNTVEQVQIFCRSQAFRQTQSYLPASTAAPEIKSNMQQG